MKGMVKNMSIPRPEYPRPQFVRDAFLNLNGEWEFVIDRQNSGAERALQKAASLPGHITVPFCPESSLSGVHDTDFMESVWYRRALTLPESFAGRRVLLNIGACDYKTTVYVNGEYVGVHIGGYVSFSFEITKFLIPGENVITINAVDDLRSSNQPSGKQCHAYASRGCSYTRTTGIWQTVWLEAVPEAYIVSVKQTPSVSDCKLSVEAVCDHADGMILSAEAFYEGKSVGRASASVTGKSARLELRLSELHLWEVGAGRLYTVRYTLGEDTVGSYFGERDIAYKNGALHINGRPVFQRLVLDQGFYPDGIYTARDDSELVADIERSLAMGFNGARLHQKVFEPRFLYHCDRLGYIVWGEHASWGLDISRPSAWAGFIPEWLEILVRDYNHPAIVGWCPLNETNAAQDRFFVRQLAAATRMYDPTRMYLDTSGYVHVTDMGDVSDLVDEHNYEQDPEKFAAHYAPLANGEDIEVFHNGRGYRAKMTFCSEYGGILWNPDSKAGWGYGNGPETEQAFIERYRGLTSALLDNKGISAFCYTQLTDVEQELNGLYTYDRKPKFDPALVHSITSAKAAIEE